MRPQLHPDAASNFDKKAEALLAELVPESTDEESSPPTGSSRPGAYAKTITEDEILDFRITGKQDQLGNTAARYFTISGAQIGLEGENYKRLAKLSESIQRTKEYQDLVSAKWVENRILDWLQAKYKSEAVNPLSDYLADKCEEDVKEHEFWFPVSHLSLDSDLVFGNVVFKTITEALMDQWEQDMQSVKEGRSESYAGQVDMFIDRERSDLQGLAAATAKINAEHDRAFQVALRESQRAVAMLRVYHAAATTIPEVTSYCALVGTEGLESIKNLKVNNGHINGMSESTSGNPELHFHLSNDDIRKYTRSFGFDKVNQLLATKNKTSFQATLLDALMLYSRSTQEKDLAGRFVYVFAAMESALLKNSNEPIQQNVGERMAFLIAKDADARRSAIGNLRDAYTLRSKFVHHGHTIEERDTVWRFIVNAWALFTTLSRISQEYETKEELIEAIEQRRLS